MKVTERQTEKIFLLSIILVGLTALLLVAIDPLLAGAESPRSQDVTDVESRTIADSQLAKS